MVVSVKNNGQWVEVPALQGSQGAAGTNGTNGQDGVGISSIAFKEIDSNGNNVYTITLTNSNTYDFTAPKGPAGTNGANGNDYTITNADYAAIAALVYNNHMTNATNVGY